MAALGPVLFMPASLTVIVSGGTLVWAGAWPFDAWVVLALAGVGASFLMGALIIGPDAGRAAAAMAAGDEATALREGGRLMLAGRVEQVLLLAVVALMVTKPGWDEPAALVVVGLSMLFGWAVLLAGPARRRAIRAA